MAVVARRASAGVRSGGFRAGRPLLALLAIVAVLAAGALAATLVYADRALPRVTVAGIAVGSLDAPAVRARLGAELSAPWAAATVTARGADRIWTTTNSALGIEPDLDAAASAAIAYGKSGSVVDRARAWIEALRGTVDVPFTMRAHGDAAERWVSQLAADVAITPVEGEIRRTATGLTLTDPVIGRELDRAHAVAALLDAAALGDREIALRTRAIHPAVDASGYAAAAALARSVTTPLEITSEGRVIREDPAGLTTLLQVERVIATDAPAVPAGATAPATRYRYVVTLDEARVRAWAQAVSAALDRPAKSASYTMRPDGTFAVVAAEAGVKIDQDAFVSAALDALARPVATPARTLEPPFVKDTPVFTTEMAQQYAGKMTRVATYETFFPPDLARWKNISTGAAQFNGLVIPPGETFSFWHYLGPVTVQRGYAFAGAIIDGRSNDDVIGGGLCQVSTTLFNAVARAGYEVVERGAHSYYIDRYPLGLDAAVFDPGLDFRWRNDTAFPVFIRSSWSNIAVEFELFTVPTGRSVSFSAPFQTNWRDVAAGQPADPHFPPGSKVLGRDVTVTRTVTEGGRVVHRDVFTSRYVPVWGGPAPAPAE